LFIYFVLFHLLVCVLRCGPCVILTSGTSDWRLITVVVNGLSTLSQTVAVHQTTDSCKLVYNMHTHRASTGAVDFIATGKYELTTTVRPSSEMNEVVRPQFNPLTPTVAI